MTEQSDARQVSQPIRPATVVAALLALLGLASLPWPLSPLGGTPWISSALVPWAATELAFLLPLLRDLTSDEGTRVRAASREAQLGAGGRVVLWLAVAGSAYLAGGWTATLAPARILLGLAATLALPLALGWGPFGPERGLAPHLAPRAGLERLAFVLRATALLAAVALAWLPAGTLAPLPGLVLALALTGLLALLLRWMDGRVPRMPLPLALRFCWLLALPLGLAGLSYLALREL